MSVLNLLQTQNLRLAHIDLGRVCSAACKLLERNAKYTYFPFKDKNKQKFTDTFF